MQSNKGSVADGISIQCLAAEGVIAFALPYSATAAFTPIASLSPPRALYSNTRNVEMTSKTDVVHSDPDILSGTPVFVGTRVPVQSLFDYLEAGDTLDEFLRQFPSVTRDQAVAALELARDQLLTSARPA